MASVGGEALSTVQDEDFGSMSCSKHR